MTRQDAAIQFHPLTPKRWPDFETLFGKRGACGGCWCMWWRQTRAEFSAGHGERNRRAMKRIVESGEVPGILAYVKGEAVGWCAVAPRERYSSVERSRVLKRLDDEPVWSIVCLYVTKEHRGQGVAVALIRGAVDYAARRGARIVEAYPTMPRGRRLADISSFMGVPAQYEKAGFTVRARPSAARAVMRRVITLGTVLLAVVSLAVGCSNKPPERTDGRPAQVTSVSEVARFTIPFDMLEPYWGTWREADVGGTLGLYLRKSDVGTVFGVVTDGLDTLALDAYGQVTPPTRNGSVIFFETDGLPCGWLNSLLIQTDGRVSFEVVEGEGLRYLSGRGLCTLADGTVAKLE
jgi:GNAT superfamily N-acetyltransferase